VVFQSSVKSLDAFALGPASEAYSEVISRNNVYTLLDQSNAQIRYQGIAPFANSNREVTCWERENVLQLDVDSQPMCRIDPSEDHIHILNDAGFDQPLNLEVVTGPALILLLAQKAIYCLHASAVSSNGGVVVFIAESGVGKSTLSTHQGVDWQQIADDILPVKMSQNPRCLGQFPQLKLSGAVTPGQLAEPVELDLIMHLSAAEVSRVSFKRLSRKDALLQIVRHTVAARLYDNVLLKTHSRFAKRLSGRVPVVELRYPRDLERLADLRRSIIDYLVHRKFD